MAAWRASTYLVSVSQSTIERVRISDEEDTNEQEDSVKERQMSRQRLNASNTRALLAGEVDLALIVAGDGRIFVLVLVFVRHFRGLRRSDKAETGYCRSESATQLSVSPDTNWGAASSYLIR